MTNKQKNDIEVVQYFIPSGMKSIVISENDKKMFLEWSEKGLHKDKVSSYRMDGLNALVQGKEWRGVMMGEWEQGILEASVPYYTLLGGDEDGKGHNPIPQNVVRFMQKEMFKGVDSDLIESVYKSISK